ncbi:11856_t:CDS:2 [Dentiscutata heterogama]|uniref:11856_t:CDS:1 n=1 Tax=Dentiscutata heterogama TaxID=1316150 RepID=A0ACA9KTN2_9GLOM|nr:11856_t:CDS:2 [Dentiscutata heterogama]
MYACESTPSRIPIILKSLVVDDNLITSEILSKILTKKFKHQVICISSSSEALNLLSQDIYDFIFMDIDMPILSGIEMSIKIRNSTTVMEKNREIPIFAYTTKEWEKEFSNASMNGYIQKPTSYDKVQTVIGKFRKNINSISDFNPRFEFSDLPAFV